MSLFLCVGLLHPDDHGEVPEDLHLCVNVGPSPHHSLIIREDKLSHCDLFSTLSHAASSAFRQIKCHDGGIYNRLKKEKYQSRGVQTA